MHVFETILLLLVGATVLSAFARRIGIPYPTLIALGGMGVAFLPGGPRLDLPPDLILALFVAPILLDAAYDASLRDLQNAWLPVLSLVLVAVSVTTVAVAFAAHMLFPDMPWAAAIALGALVAPPDAVAALAVMRHVNPPHRIRVVLEGESLLNDASALLIYKLAVGAVAAGAFSISGAVPIFGLVVVGSIFAGWALARTVGFLAGRIEDAAGSVIFQFVLTFAVWIAAERLGLSGVVTIVVFALTLARHRGARLAARLRVASNAIWEAATGVLNVLAFALVGLQIRPILEDLGAAERFQYLSGALAILAVAIVVRLAWVMTHHTLQRGRNRVFGRSRAPTSLAPPTARGALVIGWSGMRGIVTLAAAMALPADFPYRDFIQLTAFVVVLGTLVLQGLTLRPLLQFLGMPTDTTIDREVGVARQAALGAALAKLEGDGSPTAQRLKAEYAGALGQVQAGADPRDTPEQELRLALVAASRDAIDDLRAAGTIGDTAYRRVEEELDRTELSAQTAAAAG